MGRHVPPDWRTLRQINARDSMHCFGFYTADFPSNQSGSSFRSVISRAIGTPAGPDAPRPRIIPTGIDSILDSALDVRIPTVADHQHRLLGRLSRPREGHVKIFPRRLGMADLFRDDDLRNVIADGRTLGQLR